ncbi:MAG: hypothetical protein QOD38_1448, partial [Acidimicrobiaceae bacterium]
PRSCTDPGSAANSASTAAGTAIAAAASRSPAFHAAMSARAAFTGVSAGCAGRTVVGGGGAVVVLVDVVVVDAGGLDAELCVVGLSSLLHASAKRPKPSMRYTARRRIEAGI